MATAARTTLFEFDVTASADAPQAWPMLGLPREEYVGDGAIYRHEDRFPSPAIFPEYHP